MLRWQFIAAAAIPPIVALLCYVLVNYIINKEWFHAYLRCAVNTFSPIKCNQNDPTKCHQINGYTFGWCLDPEINGPLPGSASGPIDFQCRRWIWNPRQCPPPRCTTLEKNPEKRRYGWCHTQQRAMLGSSCGPNKPNTCKDWVWDPKKCAYKCPRPPIKTIKKPTVKVSASIKSAQSDCKLKCGLMKDGKKIPCPPPGCSDPTCSITCGKLRSGNVPCPPPPCGGKQCYCKGKWVGQPQKK